MRKIILFLCGLILIEYSVKSQNIALFYYPINDTCVHVLYNDTINSSLDTALLNPELEEFMSMIENYKADSSDTMNIIVYQSARIVSPINPQCDALIIQCNNKPNRRVWTECVPIGFQNILLSEEDYKIVEFLFLKIIMNIL